MGRFISIPGMAPSGGEGGMNANPGFDPRSVIESELGQRQLGDWLKSRDSHQSVGLDEKFHFVDAAGEARPAIPLHEERDQHSGKVDVTFRASSQSDSGTYKATFEPANERSMKMSRIKRVHE